MSLRGITCSTIRPVGSIRLGPLAAVARSSSLLDHVTAWLAIGIVRQQRIGNAHALMHLVKLVRQALWASSLKSCGTDAKPSPRLRGMRRIADDRNPPAHKGGERVDGSRSRQQNRPSRYGYGTGQRSTAVADARRGWAAHYA